MDDYTLQTYVSSDFLRKYPEDFFKLQVNTVVPKLVFVSEITWRLSQIPNPSVPFRAVKSQPGGWAQAPLFFEAPQ